MKILVCIKQVPDMDEHPDLIYRKDEIYNSPQPEHSYFSDTLRAEIWDGYQYRAYPIEDFQIFL